MKTQLHVLVPGSITLLGIGDAVNKLLEPHRLKHDDIERHPDWRFDYLCRFDSTLNCAETNSELPRDMFTDYAGYVSRADRLRPDVSAGALVTPDGHCHDSSEVGFRLMNNAETNAAAIEKWDKRYWQLMREHSDCWVVETWAHS